jgi:hypothetical protein
VWAPENSWNTPLIPYSRAARTDPTNISRPSKRIFPAVELRPGKQCDKCRFAGTVLAEQHMHLAARQLKVDAVKGFHPG